MNLKKCLSNLGAVILAAFALSQVAVLAQQNTSTPPAKEEGEVTVLSPFIVKSERDSGYRKLSSVVTSRIGVSIYEAPQAIEIISGELLSDLGLNSVRQAFDYSSSVTSNSQEVFQGGTFKLRGFDLPNYINGVSVATLPNGPGYNSNDNIERIELAKGAVGLFYGNTTPNGVANYITKRPENINRTKIELGAGSFGNQKALVDTQTVVSKEYGLAYRLIASASKSETRLDQDNSYHMIAGSLSFRPNDKIHVQAEFDTTNFQQDYAALGTWNFMINPLYYQDVTAPDQTMLNYIKSKFGAADDAAARAVISTRWGANAPKGAVAWLRSDWPADHFGAYGKIVYPNSGTAVDWKSLSALGDKFTATLPKSQYNGVNRTADVTVTLSPFQSTSIQYHWIHSSNKQHFERGILVPNPGPLGSDGRLFSMGIGAFTIQQLESDSDTQQLDFSQQVDFKGIKNRFIAGLEKRRISSFNGSATLNLTKGPTKTAPDGTITTGRDSLIFFSPFSLPYPEFLPLQSSRIIRTKGKPNEFQDWYASYRGVLFGDKLNVLAGVRDVKQKTSGLLTTGTSNRTWSFGAIGQVLPGLYAFASYSSTFQFASGHTVTFLSNGQPVPGEGVALSPESGKGYEFGFKSALLDGKLSGTVSYFIVERDSIAAPDNTLLSTDPRNTDTNPNNDVRFLRNGGLQRSTGIDADLVWSPINSLQILGNFTYTSEARVVSDPAVNTNINISEANARQYDKEFRHRLSKSPEFSANLVGKYSFTGGSLDGLFVGGGVRYTSRYSISDVIFYDIYVNPETFFDAFAGYRLKAFRVPTTVQLNLTNLSNKINDVTRDSGFVAQLRVSLVF